MITITSRNYPRAPPENLGIVKISRVVPVNADPRHLSAVEDLLLSDDGNVVLRLAGDGTGIAAGTGVEIDGHTPGVACGRLEFVIVE